VAVIKAIPFDPENSGASIAIIWFYIGQAPGPESPCIVFFTLSFYFVLSSFIF
jgi:hypothetical protein